MRDAWMKTTLGSVCDLTKGATPTQKARPGPYPLVVTAEERASCDEYQFDTEAVCVPMVSSTGHGHASLKRVHYQAGKFAVANIITACTAKPVAAVDMKYLWLLLDHFRDQLIVPLMKGTANVSLSQRSLALVPISLPTLGEQRRIVDLVGALDDAISAAVVALQGLRDAARQLRRRRFFEAATTAPSVVAGEIFDMLLGRQKSARQSVGDHVIPYLRAANISSDGFLLDNVQTMNFSPAEQERYCLRQGDVMLIEGGATLGRSAMWSGQIDGPIGFDKHMIRLRGVPGRSIPAYALQWTRWAYEGGAFDAQATGITIRSLGFARSSSMPVPFLNESEQCELIAPLQQAEEVLAGQRSLISNLRNLRAQLLTAILSGEHEIPESYDRLMGVAS